MKQLTILIISILMLTSQVHAQNKARTYQLPAVDVFAEQNKAISAKDVPLKYAVGTAVKDIYHLDGQVKSGQWTEMFDGSWEYNLRLHAEHATSLNIGMKDFYLPPTAQLWVSTDDESVLRGPYDGSYNQKHGFFWVGDVPADHMNIRITVSDKYKSFLSFQVGNVTRGFHKYWEEPSYINKSGSCNVDVACPEGDAWESQINSVGRYTFTTSSGSFVCTGQLINNTAQDGDPLFSTADHCGYSGNNGQNPLTERQNTAASIALTWNYQSLTCRAPGSSQSGVQISTSGFNDRQSGATYLASNPASDFALVRLNQPPSSAFGLEFTGWDRRDIAPSDVVSIHHPSGHAKRISFDHDATSITSYLQTARGAGTHIRVADWDLGTTEGGSSGSGLWNSDKLFVGQLHGGFAACGNDRDDWYGRMFVSWDNGNDAQSRMKDWLDPANTGQETLQGTGGCSAPTVDIINNSSNQVGELLSFSALVGGGAGGYTYEWEINGDEGIDGNEAQIEARYNQTFVGNLTLQVKDSAGCQTTASQPIVIISPDVQLEQTQNINNSLNQVCGNNDNVIDPGERWRGTLTARNLGSVNASSAYLALGKSRSSANGGRADNYGNQATSCERLFIDIENTGTLKTWESAGVQNYAAADEGSVLIQLANGFDHYGENVTALRASTNGYLSTSTASKGDAWANDCPLPATPARDNNGGRIAPMHDDLNGSSFYHQTFDVCPRTAETETTNALGCEVFTWKGADLWATNDVTESIDFQAILYPATSQWVYQYSGTGLDSASSTIGIQNAAANDGLSYACNTANSINTSEAVCVFNKNNQPQAGGTDYVMLETPVVSLGDISVNQSKQTTFTFAIAEDAVCGGDFSISHEASVFDEGFNPGSNDILTQTIGNGGQCNVVTSCDVGTSDANSNNITPRAGLWWNPDRNGNGFDWYTINGERLLYYFYTGKSDREPIWYLANDADSAYNQYHNQILEVSVPGGFGNGTLGTNVIGWSNTSFIDDSNAIQVREINGMLSAEKLIFQQYGPDETPNLHTGPYYTPAENGWGHSMGTLGDFRVALTFLYDNDGNPYWTIGSGANDNSAFDVFHVQSFCHSCPAVTANTEVIGEVQMTLNGQRDGTLVKYSANRDNVNWNKTNLPLEIIILPEN